VGDVGGRGGASCAKITVIWNAAVITKTSINLLRGQIMDTCRAEDAWLAPPAAIDCFGLVNGEVTVAFRSGGGALRAPRAGEQSRRQLWRPAR